MPAALEYKFHNVYRGFIKFARLVIQRILIRQHKADHNCIVGGKKSACYKVMSPFELMYFYT